MIERQLARLGLEGKKGRLYQAVLELGEAPVTVLAERAGITRTTAYDLLSDLIAQGLVTQTLKNGKTHVIAEDPVALQRPLDERRRVLDEVLPDIRAVFSGSRVKPRIHYYQGMEGIRTILDDTLSCRSGLVRGILSMVELNQAPGSELMETHIRQRIRAGLPLRVVRSAAEDVARIWRSHPEELREVRFAPPGVTFTMTTYLYDDKAAFISSSREGYALLIQSEEFIRLQLSVFEALWSLSTSDRG